LTHNWNSTIFNEAASSIPAMKWLLKWLANSATGFVRANFPTCTERLYSTIKLEHHLDAADISL
jgi:hypothetical protein